MFYQNAETRFFQFLCHFGSRVYPLLPYLLPLRRICIRFFILLITVSTPFPPNLIGIPFFPLLCHGIAFGKTITPLLTSDLPKTSFLRLCISVFPLDTAWPTLWRVAVAMIQSAIPVPMLMRLSSIFLLDVPSLTKYGLVMPPFIPPFNHTMFLIMKLLSSL